MAYHLEGRLLEVCNCNVLCPCWIGENPDNGTCDSGLAWRIDKGKIEDVDVSGLTFGMAVHIPGNILQGNWKVNVFVDEKASSQQQEALLKTFTGQLGGPIADFAALVGEVLSVERVPITFTVEGGKGTLMFGQTLEVELAPYLGATGKSTSLQETVF